MPETQQLTPPHRRTVALTLVAGLTLGLFASVGLATAAPASADTTAARLFTGNTPAQVVSQSEADAAIADARAVLTSSAAVVTKAAASGLDLGDSPTTIDTQELVDTISALDDDTADTIVARSALTTGLTAQTAVVSTQAASLQTRIDDAVAAQKAAAAKAAAAAAAEAQAAANTVEGAKSTARTISADQYGWGDDQFQCLDSLWTKESGWNYQAYNNDGGATGIPQALPGSKMASFGNDWATNATTQIKWGLDYISSVYGSPCSAWGHSQSVNWY